MARAPSVGADIDNPTHELSLSDGTTTIGLRLCDPRGRDTFYAIRRSPYPRTGLKISQQETKYTDAELPYVTMEQDNWVGGRGALIFEDDKSKYADNYRCHAEFEGKVFPASAERYMTGIIPVNVPNPNFEYGQLEGSYWELFPFSSARTHFAVKIINTSAATEYIDEILFYPSIDSTAAGAGDLIVEWWSNSGGLPGSKISTIGTVSEGAIAPNIQQAYIMTNCNISMSASTTYWIVFTTSNYKWRLLCNGGTAANYYYNTNTLSWALTSTWGNAYFSAKDIDANLSGNMKFFQYKGMQWCAVNGYIYQNGYGGIISNAVGGNTIYVSGTPWTTNEWAGCTFVITLGDSQPNHAKIVSNTSNTLTLDSKIYPSIGDEFVILGSNKWRQVAGYDTSAKITDVAVAGDFVYLAVGLYGPVWRFEWSPPNSIKSQSEYVYAHRLCAIYNSGEKRYYLYGALIGDKTYGNSIWKMAVPPLPTRYAGAGPYNVNYLYRPLATLETIEERWDELPSSNVSVEIEDLNNIFGVDFPSQEKTLKITVDAAHTTGILATKMLSNPVDVTEARHIAFRFKSEASLNSGAVRFILSDDEIWPNPYTATGISARIRNPNLLYHFSGTTYTDMANARDADTGTNYALSFNTGQYIYIGSSKPFATIYWNFGATKNSVAATLTVQYMSSSSGLWTNITLITNETIVSGAPFAASGRMIFNPPPDWRTFTVSGNNLYWIRISTSTNLTANINVNEVLLWGYHAELNIPAVNAEEWTWIVLDISPNSILKYYNSVRCIGLRQAVDKGANVLRIQGDIILTSYAPKYITVQGNGRIQRIVPYGNENTRPWVITEEAVYEIQTDNNDVVVPIPLAELKQLASSESGLDAISNDVYLYFNLGQRLERYHDRLLEDIGPNRDEGLPNSRAGNIYSLASLPSAVYAAVNGPSFSSVLVRRGGGWHEIYRSPYSYTASGAPDRQWIWSIQPQAIPGDYQRLWILQGNNLLWINIPISSGESFGNYWCSSTMITPWITCNLLDVTKVFRTLKLHTENLSSRSLIYAEYQLDTGSLENYSPWYPISQDNGYDTSPFQTKEINLTPSGTAGTVQGRMIRFRFRFSTQDKISQPILKAWSLDSLVRLDVKHAYTVTVRLKDRDSDLGGSDDYELRAESLQAQLDAWAGSPPAVLTMRSIYSTFDNKRVIVEPYSIKPYTITIVESGKSVEAHLAEITLLEV